MALREFSGVKDVIVLGGPNGAGKTTIAAHLLPGPLGIREFVNADEIARGLSPFNSEAQAAAAARLMLTRITGLAAAGESFCFETTCAGLGHVQLLKQLRESGYRVSLIFLWLPSPEAALVRVAHRVKNGGHAIPEDVVRRRYAGGLRNMSRLYLPLADIVTIYDNSSDGRRNVIATKAEHDDLRIVDPMCWALIDEATR